MTDEKPDPLAEIKETVLRVVRLAYLRPIINETSVSPFQMSEDEIANTLEPYKAKIKADMDILSECLRAAYQQGSGDQPQPEINDDIVIRGNQND